MPYQAGRVILALCLLAGLLFPPSSPAAGTFYDLPPRPAPELFGNFLIDRTSTASGVKPVSFSHWAHRIFYTCNVCHTELEFNMKVNTTEITQAEIEDGLYCGACHDGRRAFSAATNCAVCHNGDIGHGRELFSVFSRYAFVPASYGNSVDWSESLRRGVLAPARFLEEELPEMSFDKDLVLKAEMGRIPPAVFSHKAHLAWMDCDICHPEVFNIKKKTTENFSMSAILRGEFCGACHLNVAFPMDDCARCHPEVQ